MDIGLCDKCELFRCRLTRSVTHVGNGFHVVNYLIVVECDGNAVAVEAVGNAVVTTTAFSLIELGITGISVESMPDEVRQDYDNAIERIVAKLTKVNDFRNCKYMTEQMVLDFNEEE